MLARYDNAAALAAGVGIGTLLTWLAIRRTKFHDDSRTIRKETKDEGDDLPEIAPPSAEPSDRSCGHTIHRGDATCEPYVPPHWVVSHPSLRQPSNRLRLAHLPTPLHRWNLPASLVSNGVDLWIKRDDYTGAELSGNKVRKLDFLLAEALAQGADSVITCGGVQSNHCRATAAAARRVGLQPHVVLRVPNGAATRDPGWQGNLMVMRLVGATLHLVAAEEYDAKGGYACALGIKAQLEAKGAKLYAFPSGGSNSVGSWGYVEAIAELDSQARAAGVAISQLYFACGSGGTAAGLALGLGLLKQQQQQQPQEEQTTSHSSSASPKSKRASSAGGTANGRSGSSVLGLGGAELVALGVDDSPEDFYNKIEAIHNDMGVPASIGKVRSLLRIEHSVGEGYAVATSEELSFLAEVARSTGVVLDPVYSGKAALGMVRDLKKNTNEGVQGKQEQVLQHVNTLPRRPTAVFLHTGGLLGLMAKEAQIAATLPPWKPHDNA